MASIKKYPTAKGHAWRVQYRSPDGKSRTKRGFRTKNEAENWAAANATAIATGGWVDPQKSRITIHGLKDQYFATKAHLKPSSLRVMHASWDNYIEPTWGTTPITAIRRPDVQAWVSAHAEHPVVIRRALGLLAGVLDMAVDDGRIPMNHARGVTLPKKPEPKRIYFTGPQLAALAQEAGPHGLIILGLGTVGLRWGELTGLQVGDIPTTGRRFKVTRSISWAAAGKYHVVGLKNNESRVVAASEQVMRGLRAVAENRDSSEWLFGDGHTPMKPPGHHSWFASAVRKCLADGSIPARVTPHGLRHVAAGLLVASGASVKVVQRQLGHKSAAVTLDRYADLFDDDLDVVADAMDSVLSGVVKMSSNGSILRVV